jgi:hypothetical protein
MKINTATLTALTVLVATSGALARATHPPEASPSPAAVLCVTPGTPASHQAPLADHQPENIGASAATTLMVTKPAQGLDLDWVVKTGRQYFAPWVDLDVLVDIGRGIGMWQLWYCQYADGTIVYNEFRFYRTTADVYMYFTGRPGSHDCDAWSEYGQFCTREAMQFARQHGGIVGVGHASRG